MVTARWNMAVLQYTIIKSVVSPAFLLCLALAASASPPKRSEMRFEPYERLKALRAGYDGVFNAVEKLAATPLEPKHAPAMKGLIDDATRSGATAAAAAADLLAAGVKSFEEMSKAFLGTSSEPSATNKSEDILSSLSLSKQRRALLFEHKRKLKERLDRHRRRDADRETLVKQAYELLEKSERSIKASEGSLKDIQETFSDYKSAFGKAQGSLVEVEFYTQELARVAEALRAENPKAKAAADLLSVEPHHVTRGQAMNKLRPTLDAGRALYLAHDSLRNRADDLSSRSVKFIPAYDRFEVRLLEMNKPIVEAKALLDQSEAVLNSLKSWLDKTPDQDR